MTPRFETINDKKLVGKRLKMSFADFRIGELWGGFMPRRKEINNAVSGELYSVAVYSTEHFAAFNPTNEFERWAAVEVTDFDNIPAGLETFHLPGGQYAVFSYKGPSTDKTVFRYIYETWLPGSGYVLDDRPHFEVLGAKYKNNDPDSEEEIWIPVRAVS